MDTNVLISTLPSKYIREYFIHSWYVCNMLKSDYWGSGISDEQHLALSIKDYLDDKDANVGSEKPFRYFFSICSGNGTVIPWKECL